MFNHPLKKQGQKLYPGQKIYTAKLNKDGVAIENGHCVVTSVCVHPVYGISFEGTHYNPHRNELTLVTLRDSVEFVLIDTKKERLQKRINKYNIDDLPWILQKIAKITNNT